MKNSSLYTKAEVYVKAILEIRNNSNMSDKMLQWLLKEAEDVFDDLIEIEMSDFVYEYECANAKQALNVRKTFKYRYGWSGLDEWINIGSFKYGECLETSPRDEYDGYSSRYIITVDSIESEKLVIKAINYSLSGSSCTHEHDCCGCSTNSTQSVKKIDDCKYEVVIGTSFNF